MQGCRLFGLQCLEFWDANQRGPKDVGELQGFTAQNMISFGPPANSNEELISIYKEIEEGKFVVVWNAVMFNNGNEGNKYVLAYEKSASESEGIVIMGDGRVDQRSAEEFAKLELMPTIEEESDSGEKE